MADAASLWRGDALAAFLGAGFFLTTAGLKLDKVVLPVAANEPRFVSTPPEEGRPSEGPLARLRGLLRLRAVD